MSTCAGKNLTGTVLAVILALPPSLVAAQEMPSFVAELTALTEIDDLSVAARELNWDAAAGARPEAGHPSLLPSCTLVRR